jgi:hypothetical protein
MRPEGLGNLIKIINLIGSRTRDLQVCNIAPYQVDLALTHHRNLKQHMRLISWGM